MGVIGTLHSDLVSSRRAQVLTSWFESLLPKNASILDVGCGDGVVAASVQSSRPDVTIRGVDVLPRERPHIPVEIFDGSKIPYPDSSFDVVMISDVLHHTEDPNVILREAHRVTRAYVLIKDHYRQGIAAQTRLRFMDWLGNARFGVSLPYNYWTPQQWKNAWDNIGLRVSEMRTDLHLYPKPADWVFGSGLHFITLLEKCTPAK